jgi:hypothetical protein
MKPNQAVIAFLTGNTTADVTRDTLFRKLGKTAEAEGLLADELLLKIYTWYSQPYCGPCSGAAPLKKWLLNEMVREWLSWHDEDREKAMASA